MRLGLRVNLHRPGWGVAPAPARAMQVAEGLRSQRRPGLQIRQAGVHQLDEVCHRVVGASEQRGQQRCLSKNLQGAEFGWLCYNIFDDELIAGKQCYGQWK